MRGGAIWLVGLVVLAGCLGFSTTDEPSDDPGSGPPGIVESRLTPSDQSASEVSIQANPVDPLHLVAAANSEGGFGVYVTRDGGDTWTAHRFDPEDAQTGPAGPSRYTALSDPVVAFAPDGERVYLAALAYLPTSAVVVAVSEDGGASFDETHVVAESEPGATFNDKEWLGVNPETGTLLVAWQREPALDQLRGVEQATGVDADVGWIVVSRSTDEGRSWSTPEIVSRGMHSNGTQIAFTQGGRAHVAWVNYETNTLDHIASDDDGQTWTDPEAIADVDTVPSYPRYQRMHTLPAMVADEDGQAVYVVWHDDRHGDADVMAVASSDAGETWGEVTRVNADPVGNGAAQIYPWAAVGPDERVHVSWYDTREDPDPPRLRFYHASAPGPSLAFSNETPVSTTAFTAFCEEAPGGPTDAGSCTEQRSLGDYTSLAASSAGVFPAWADGRGEASAIYAARLPGDQAPAR